MYRYSSVHTCFTLCVLDNSLEFVRFEHKKNASFGSTYLSEEFGRESQADESQLNEEC